MDAMASEVSTAGAQQELRRRLAERERELREAHQREAATAELLQVINRPQLALQSVFDAIAQSAGRLCEAEFASVFRFDGEFIGAAALYGVNSEGLAAQQKEFPRPAGEDTSIGRAILRRAVVQIPDVQADPTYGLPALVTYRSVMAVPFLRDGHPIGGIAVGRAQAGPFPEGQIRLLRSFADLAVIAIENSRLFEAEQASKRELQESLDQQTATADVLKVISRSALDVQKVLDALVESAARLCDAYDATIFQVVGDGLRLVAHHGQFRHPVMRAPVGQLTVPLVRGAIIGRVVLDRRTIHVADALAEAEEYPENDALRLGFRTVLAVPLVHAGKAIGAIFIWRSEVRPFTERQVELVNTF